jgi:hypothetical protein
VLTSGDDCVVSGTGGRGGNSSGGWGFRSISLFSWSSGGLLVVSFAGSFEVVRIPPIVEESCRSESCEDFESLTERFSFCLSFFSSFNLPLVTGSRR